MGCNFFGVKNWPTLAALWAGALSCNKKKSQFKIQSGQRQYSGTTIVVQHQLFASL
jgi:hypothetical protein